MTRDPADDQLIAFIDAMLSNLDRQLREPAVLEQALRDNRPMWVLLYRVSQGIDDLDDSEADLFGSPEQPT